ncbi:hypothetical protein V6N13_094290 [Hibiscus sabdariffa]
MEDNFASVRIWVSDLASLMNMSSSGKVCFRFRTVTRVHLLYLSGCKGNYGTSANVFINLVLVCLSVVVHLMAMVLAGLRHRSVDVEFKVVLGKNGDQGGRDIQALTIVLAKEEVEVRENSKVNADDLEKDHPRKE